MIEPVDYDVHIAGCVSICGQRVTPRIERGDPDSFRLSLGLFSLDAVKREIEDVVIAQRAGLGNASVFLVQRPGEDKGDFAVRESPMGTQRPSAQLGQVVILLFSPQYG